MTDDTKLGFFVFDNLRCSQDGEGGNVYRFDTLDEAVACYERMPQEWTTALGGSRNDLSELDLVQRRQGVNTLVTDFNNFPEWKNDPQVQQAIGALMDKLGIGIMADRSIMEGPIMIPIDAQDPAEDRYLADKKLRLRDSASLTSAINEAFVQGEGWVSSQKLSELSRDFGYHNPNCPFVTQLNVAYEARDGHAGQMDITPREYAFLVERALREALSVQEKGSTARRDTPNDLMRRICQWRDAAAHATEQEKAPVKTMAGWEEYALTTGDHGLGSYLQPGDRAGQDMVDHFLSLVPPALMGESLFQVGTPYDSQPGPDGQMHPTFATFSKEGEAWAFCGYCFLGKTDEPTRDPSLIRSEGGSRPEYDYITNYGQLERVTLEVGAYGNGGLRVAMESFDRDMGERVRFADMTIDAGKALPPLTAAIDTETHGEEVVEFLVEEGFGEPTGEQLAEGELTHLLFRFNEKKLAEADPCGLESYRQVNDIDPERGEADKKSLDTVKLKAQERVREHNADRLARQRSRKRDMEL